MTKMKQYIYIALAAMTFAGCSSENIVEDNSGKTPILLSANIGDVQGSVVTRATVPLSSSKIALRVEGTWTGHTTTPVIQYPTGSTTGDADANNYKTLNVTPKLYWDDYGTADANNTDTGRADGLTIYGAAIDGNSVTVADEAEWSSKAWTLDQDQKTLGWSTKDLLFSNNIKNGTPDGRYKFANRATAAKLIFQHAMSKITINLITGDGFTVAETANSSVTLKNFAHTGTVDIAAGTSTGSTIGDITMHKESTPALGGAFATYTALVFPKSDQFTYADANSPYIAEIVVNGNTYKIQANAIIKAIDGTYETGTKATELGKNYIFDVTVKKTAVEVSATVADWTPVTAENTSPSNATAMTFKTETKAMTSNFTLYGSEQTSENTASTTTTGFTKTTGVKNGNPLVTYTYSGSTYTPSTTVYWPDNNTYYHFRGISPMTATVTEDATSGDYVTLTSANETYTDVMWGAPYTTAGAICSALGPTSNAIGLIFNHKMAQVIFALKTTTTADKVVLTGTNTVKLSCKGTGLLRLGDGTVNGLSTTNVDLSTTTNKSYTYTEPGASQATTNNVCYLFGVVPNQSTSGLQVSVTLSDGNVYQISDLSKIKVNGGSAITTWEPGKTYIYTLTLKKTGILALVTAIDWVDITTENTDVTIK